MADGLLSGVLPYVYGRLNAFQRYVSDIPNQLSENSKAFNELQAEARNEFVNTGSMTGPKQMQLANTLAESYNPGGLIGARFKTGTPTQVPGFGMAKEIPDNFSEFSGQALKDLSAIFGNKNITLSDILNHPSLYRDYPELAKYPVTGLGLFQKNIKGAYGDGKLYLERKFNPTTDDIASAHSTLLHEVQHAIQELDKMPMGGMTEDFLTNSYKKAATKISTMRDAASQELKNLIKDKGYPDSVYYDILFKNKKSESILKSDKDIELASNFYQRLMKSDQKMQEKYQDAFQKYKSIAGEAQARAVQQRFLNPQEYSKPVLESYDVPIESLIFKTGLESSVR